MNEINTWPGWENVDLLGEGSFGKVYRIRREEYGVVNEAALKVITIPGSSADLAAAREEGMDDASVTNYFKSFVEDLAAEFALMSSLKGNSNIVSYEDHMVVPREGEVGWDILIRMELLTPLQAAVAERPLTERDVAVLGVDLCRALTLCRKRGILHRDIKPENIFLSRDGNYKLGDFGVARVAEKTVSAMSRKGTYSYMAPEVYKGEKYGFGADIYSLGIVLYRYLNNNRLPFLPPYPEPIQYSDRENALARRIGGEELPPPVGGSGALQKAVLKACAYRAEDRYDSAESFMADLETAMQGLEDSVEENGGNTDYADMRGSYTDSGQPEEVRTAQEESGADEFDRTMSAVVLGQQEYSQGKAAGKKAGPVRNTRRDGVPQGGTGSPGAKDAADVGAADVRAAEEGKRSEEKKGEEKKSEEKKGEGKKSEGKKSEEKKGEGKKSEEKKREEKADISRKEGGSGKKKIVFMAAAGGAFALCLLVAAVMLIPGGKDGKTTTEGTAGAGTAAGKDSGTSADPAADAEAQEAAEAAKAQALQEVLAMLDTPTDQALLDSHREAMENFDGRLIGTWKRVGADHQGENRVNGLENEINIFETGEFYFANTGEWMRLMEEQIELPVMTAKDGATDIMEASKSVYDDGKQHVDGIYTMLPSITDLSVTYELTDYEAEEDNGFEAAFYANRKDDGLTIHISGNYQDGPLASRTVDTSIYFRQYTYIGRWLFPCMEGRWTDSNGYVWAFRIARESVESFGVAGNFDVAFAMKDSSGQIYEGKAITEGFDSESGMNTLRISFQEGITVPEYTLAGYDGMTLELEGEDGSSLVLTRD